MPGDGAEERIQGWLTREGFALEHAAVSQLRDGGFRPRLGIPYRDPTTDKIREADVVAMHGVTAVAPYHRWDEIEVHVVVECKRPKHAWVARVSSDLPIYKGSIRWLPIATDRLQAYLERDHAALDFLAMPLGDVAFEVVESERPDPRETNPARSAMLQVTSAAAGMNADPERFPQLTVFHPVVLIDKPLFRASFDGRGNPVVQASSYERVHWGGADRRNPVLVDVVTSDAFRDYLVWLTPQLAGLHEELLRALTAGAIATGQARIY